MRVSGTRISEPKVLAWMKVSVSWRMTPASGDSCFGAGDDGAASPNVIWGRVEGKRSVGAKPLLAGFPLSRE